MAEGTAAAIAVRDFVELTQLPDPRQLVIPIAAAARPDGRAIHPSSARWLVVVSIGDLRNSRLSLMSSKRSIIKEKNGLRGFNRVN